LEKIKISPPAFLKDLTIIIDSVPANLDGATDRGVLWQAMPGCFLLDVPGVARYLVEAGRTITIEPAKKSDLTVIQRYFDMTPTAALLFQRNIFAFHAAAAFDEGGAVLLSGDSGAGKSTLLTALLQRGWKMLADDITAVDSDVTGQLIVQQTSPQIALWPDAIERLAIAPTHRANYTIKRQEISLTDRVVTNPQRLRAIYWLSVQSIIDCELDSLEGIERFRAVGTLSYNSHIADALFNRVGYMQRASAIVRTVPIYHLRRPYGKWSVDELAEILIKNCQD
jgi:hypothetical protein